MNGDFKIDGINALSTYGVFILKGGYAQLLNLPKFKNIEITDWLDSDGGEADLSSPVIDAKTFSIQFGFKELSMLDSFYDKLSDNAVHSFNFTELGKTYQLRMTTTSSFSSLINSGTLTLSFVIDNPAITTETPYGIGYTRVTQRGNYLDDIDLSRFGCWILDGTLQSFKKAPQTKENIVINSKYSAGQTYVGFSHTNNDGQTVNTVNDVYYKCKDVTLRMLINARNLTEFWRCYNALFYRLSRSGVREIKLSDMNTSYDCFYGGSQVSKFEICKSGTIWCEFDVVLKMLNMRPTTPAES